MNKIFKYIGLLVFYIACFAANTPSQLGSYQIEAPKSLKKWLFTFFAFESIYLVEIMKIS